MKFTKMLVSFSTKDLNHNQVETGSTKLFSSQTAKDITTKKSVYTTGRQEREDLSDKNMLINMIWLVIETYCTRIISVDKVSWFALLIINKWFLKSIDTKSIKKCEIKKKEVVCRNLLLIASEAHKRNWGSISIESFKNKKNSSVGKVLTFLKTPAMYSIHMTNVLFLISLLLITHSHARHGKSRRTDQDHDTMRIAMEASATETKSVGGKCSCHCDVSKFCRSFWWLNRFCVRLPRSSESKFLRFTSSMSPS